MTDYDTHTLIRVNMGEEHLSDVVLREGSIEVTDRLKVPPWVYSYIVQEYRRRWGNKP
jgi:hypothetical protein